MEYFTFPMETMNVSQNYYDHSPHLGDPPCDYPFDNPGINTGQSAVFATVDLKVTAKRGEYQSDATNTVWLQTVNPVKTPTFEDYAFIMIAHWNDGDSAMKKWSVGSVIPKGQIICYEGNDYPSQGNHVHIVCGRGYADRLVRKIVNGSLVWVSNGDTKKPEEVIYINPFFTTVLTTKGIPFVYLPTFYGSPVSRDVHVKQVQVMINTQNAYSSANGNIIGAMNPGIYNIIQESGEYIEVEPNIWVKLSAGKVIILEAETAPSEIQTIPNTTIGNKVMITLDKKMINVTHTLRYIFGTTSATIATNVDSAYEFSLSKDLYYYMTESKSANMTIYCDTYAGDKLIGTTSTTFTVSALDLDVKPEVSITTEVDSKTQELTNDNNTIILGVTNLNYQIQTDLKYDASVVSYQIEDKNGVHEISSNGTIEKIDIEEVLKYRIIDSRGYNDWYNKEFECISYSFPILSFQVERSNKNDLEEVTVHYSGTFDSKTFGSTPGAMTNYIQAKLFYKVDNEENWTELLELSPIIENNDFHQDLVLSEKFDKSKFYSFKIVLQDLLSTIELEDDIQNEQSLNFNFIYPIGRGFMDFTGTDYTNYLGFVWEKTLLGVFPVGCDSTQEEFNTLGKTGGSKYLQSHSHSFSGVTSQNGNHTHSTMAVEAYSQTNPSKTVLRPGGWDGMTNVNSGNAAGNHTHSYSGNTSTVGRGSGENLPPYEVVNFWKRIA